MAQQNRQKIGRVVDFLAVVVRPRIASTLGIHGFSQKELDTGWDLVRQAAGTHLNVQQPKVADTAALDELDGWENRWMPIVKATLAHRHPAIHDEVFLNISQTEGPDLIVSVGMFIQRIESLARGDEQHKKAWEVLKSRGLTEKVLDEAKQHLERVGQLREPPAVDLEAIRTRQEEAVEAMWSWYLEWSTIARTAIKDGHLLYQLGFGRTRREDSEDAPVVDEMGTGTVPFTD